jgi:arylsulfatase
MAQEKRPNVVFMLADNVGYGDIGCYGAGGTLRGMPTPNIDRLASEGLRLNQFLVEPACTPSRAALLTGRYSIRSGLSLVVVPGGTNQLPPDSFTLGNLFSQSGYRTMYLGKWHLGESTESEPQFFGFDGWRYGFYGSSDGTLNGDNMSRYQAPSGLRQRGVMHIREADAQNRPSKEVFPWNLEYRRQIDNDMTDAAVEYIQQHAGGEEPFFLMMGLTRPHFPNLPSDDFKGKSRIGGYGDCMMELDHNVGRVTSAIADAGIEEETIVVFASDNGPTTTATLPEEMHLASAGPWRGELGDATEGSIRTVATIRWPGRIQPSVADDMFSIMDFLPTFAHIIDADLPERYPLDGVDQTAYLMGEQRHSSREALITFIGPRLAAVRWNQWRIYTMNTYQTNHNPALGGYLGYRNELNFYPEIFNIEADPREMRAMTIENTWVIRPYSEIVAEYMASLEKHPNPPCANVTVF